MLRKFIGIFAFMFVLALVVPVAAQRYSSCGHRGHARGHHDRYDRNVNSGRNYDRGRSYRYANYDNRRYDRGYRSYNRGRSYGYRPVYNNYYVVRRAPVRRSYRPVYSPRYYGGRSRNRISVSFGF